MDYFPINYQELIYRVNGNFALLNQIVALFFKIYPDLLKRLEEGIAKSDGRQVRHAAHTLKGMISNFAASTVVDAVRALEMVGESGDFSHVDELLDVFKEKLSELNAVLHSIQVNENQSIASM